jgi:hypothetical protein
MSQRRGRSLTPILLALVGGFVLLLLFLVVFFGISGSVGTTLSNGRNVTVNASSWSISMETDGDTCKTWTAGKEIVISGEKVSVDGRQVVAMDAATKDFAVTVDRKQITFVADGETIASCPR